MYTEYCRWSTRTTRHLIITTNFKNMLDGALLRPGRLDMKIQFTKCSSVMTKDIVEHFYNVPNKLDNVIFDNDVFTPADLVDTCFNNADNIDETIKIITQKV